MRPRKSIDEHKLQGTKPQYVVPDSLVVAARPKIPAEFAKGSQERKIFKGLCGDLEKRRTLTAGDAELIRLGAIQRVRHSRAMEHLGTEGEICTYVRLDSNGQPHDVFKENLWLAVATNAEKQLVAILDRLGLTPANRCKVKPAEKQKTVEDKADLAMLSREEALRQKDAQETDALLDAANSIDLEQIN